MKITLLFLGAAKSALILFKYLILCRKGHNFLTSEKEFPSYNLKKHTCSRCGWNTTEYIPKDDKSKVNT